MANLPPIIFDNGTGYSKIGYNSVLIIQLRKFDLKERRFAGNSEPSL